jgi:undecaprenyl-diphosphatase
VEHLIQHLANDLGKWAYLLVAFMAMAETAAFLGFIAPGEFSIILGGVLAGEGTLSIGLLIGIVWAAIVTGDSIGFLLGRKLGRGFAERYGPRIRLTSERLQRVDAYFRRHGGKTIFLGRWVGFVRPLMPFTAGTSGMPYRRFIPYDVLSAGLFGTCFSLLGFVFWRSFDKITSIAGKGAVGLGILVVVVITAAIAFKRLRRPEDRARAAAALERVGQRPVLRPLARLLGALWRYAIRPGA